MVDKMQKENQGNSTNFPTFDNSKNWEGAKSTLSELFLNNKGTENDDRKLAEAFAKLSFNQGNANDLMESVIQTAVSKDVMYTPLMELHSKFGSYLETKRDSLDKETLRNYNEQFRILTRLLQLYAEEDSLSTCSTTNINSKESKASKEARATLIANLWIEMQNYGLPPPEISPENTSASSSLNECSIM